MALDPFADLLTLTGLFYKMDRPADKDAAYQQLMATYQPLANGGPDIPFHLGVSAQHMAQFTLNQRTDLPQEEQLQLTFGYFNAAADFYEQAVASKTVADPAIDIEDIVGHFVAVVRHSGYLDAFGARVAEAQESLAWLYENGVIRDGEKNPKKAYELRLKAAHAGNADAQMNLGIMCYRGEGRAASKWRALYWMDAVTSNGAAAAEMQAEAQGYVEQISAELGRQPQSPKRPDSGYEVPDPFEPQFR